MLSTETVDLDLPAREFFVEALRPLAEQCRVLGLSFFALGPDVDAPSYYVTPPRPVMQPNDFEAASVVSSDAFVDALLTMWRDQGLDPLTAIVPALRELARDLAPGQEQDDEVSPHMYVMF